MPERPTALTKEFAALPGKQAQWKAFRGRLGSTQCPEDFTAVIDDLREFLVPVAQSIARNQPVERSWKPLGPWRYLRQR